MKSCEYMYKEYDTLSNSVVAVNIEAPIVVQQLRYEDITRASTTIVVEFEEGADPLARYVRETPDAKNFPKHTIKCLRQAMFALSLSSWVRHGIGLTVGHGVSLVAAVPPPKSRRRRRSDQIADQMISKLQSIFSIIVDSPEQRRRSKEFNSKADALIKEVLGERAQDMWSVDSLVTDPEYRRRGYAGALVDTITLQADREHRATMLFSSNTVNTEFYNSHGFFEIAHVEVGRDNPMWKEAPVIVPLMVREAQAYAMKAEPGYRPYYG